MSRLFIHSFDTNFGAVRTAATTDGLVLATLPDRSRTFFEDSIAAHFGDFEIELGGKINLVAAKQIRKYFDGGLKCFTVPLDIQGNEFAQKVFTFVATIPYGETMSYSDVARAVGHPRACRAVGNVMAHNRVALVIPCHRVVAAHGLGGYGGDLKTKKWLLEFEGVDWRRLR
jgi:methylated-DNA-[protein]-cysteine S-methyltransferase